MVQVMRLYNLYSLYTPIPDLSNYYYLLLNLTDEFNLYKIRREYVNKLRRSNNASRYISRILNVFKNPIFATFTINEENIGISPREFRSKLISLLKKNNYVYYGNLDYGEKFGRLHAHVVMSSFIDINTFGYDLGAINFMRIINDNDVALSKYLNKLANHSIKESVYGRSFTNMLKHPRKKY